MHLKQIVNGYPVQPEEVPTLGNYLPGKLDRRLLLGACTDENAEQLRTG